MGFPRFYRFYRLYPVAIGIVDEGGRAAANRHAAKPVFAVEGLLVRYAALYPSGHVTVGVVAVIIVAHLLDGVRLVMRVFIAAILRPARPQYVQENITDSAHGGTPFSGCISFLVSRLPKTLLLTETVLNDLN